MKIYQRQDPARISRVIQKSTSPQTITQLMKRKKNATYFPDLASLGSSIGASTQHNLSTTLTYGGTNYTIIPSFRNEHPIYDGIIANVAPGTFEMDTAYGLKTYTLHFTITGYSSETSNTLATFDAYGYSSTNEITHLNVGAHSL